MIYTYTSLLLCLMICITLNLQCYIRVYIKLCMYAQNKVLGYVCLQHHFQWPPIIFSAAMDFSQENAGIINPFNLLYILIKSLCLKFWMQINH